MTEEVIKVNAWKPKEKNKYRDTIDKIYQVRESKEWAEAYKVAVMGYTKEKNKKKGRETRKSN